MPSLTSLRRRADKAGYRIERQRRVVEYGEPRYLLVSLEHNSLVNSELGDTLEEIESFIG